MFGFIACVFIAIGMFFTASSFAIQTESAIHQIYQQLCVLTGVVTMGVGFIMLTIRSIKVKAENPNVVELPIKTMEEAKQDFLNQQQENEEEE